MATGNDFSARRLRPDHGRHWPASPQRLKRFMKDLLPPGLSAYTLGPLGARWGRRQGREAMPARRRGLVLPRPQLPRGLLQPPGVALRLGADVRTSTGRMNARFLLPPGRRGPLATPSPAPAPGRSFATAGQAGEDDAAPGTQLGRASARPAAARVARGYRRGSTCSHHEDLRHPTKEHVHPKGPHYRLAEKRAEEFELVNVDLGTGRHKKPALEYMAAHQPLGQGPRPPGRGDFKALRRSRAR